MTPYPTHIPTPYYALEETALRRNLALIARVAREAGVEIILAFKAYALWKSFSIFREYISSSTASSLYEARMGYEELGGRVHTYAPVYKGGRELEELLGYTSHLTFNTLPQFQEHYPQVQAFEGERVSCGLRINPEYSEVSTELYNPCAPGSRFGVLVDELPDQLPEGIEGLHFHTHCESSSYALERTLEVVERKFAPYLQQVSWINMGGGHLMTRADYDVDHLIGLLRSFRSRYPHLKVILEPGSAFGWQTGALVAQVLDVVSHHGISTLIMDASFTCHMPDCLEMPYQPTLRGAQQEPSEAFPYPYRIGGNSCLSGDVMGDWYFATPPQRGDLLIFEDMMHYTTVKTTMFNGLTHPSIYLHTSAGEWQELRTYHYKDYKERMC